MDSLEGSPQSNEDGVGYDESVNLLELHTEDRWLVELRTGFIENPGAIVATIDTSHSQPKAMIEGFGASIQRRGEGTRLMKGLIICLKERGVHELWSYSVSADALPFRKKFFGESALHFYDADHPEVGFLPVTVADAVRTTERVKELDGGPNYNFGICVNLDEVDTSGWANPTEGSGDIDDQWYEVFPRIPKTLSLEQDAAATSAAEAA